MLKNPAAKDLSRWHQLPIRRTFANMSTNWLKVICGLFVLITCAPGCSRPSTTNGEPAIQEQSNLADPVILAQAKAAKKLGIPLDSIEIVSITATNFADSSLGCPQPGMAYTQVITPGYRIITRGDSKQLTVNVSGGRGVICNDTFRSPR
jgi:hypothetical protein